MRPQPRPFGSTQLLAFAFAAATIMLGVSDASAIPAFARKYEASCQTCHVAFPKLNAFGDAFRRNGYRYPAGEDPNARAVEPVQLGHPAMKRVWPDAVWPGETPGTFPAAATLSGQARWRGDEDALDFGGLGGSAGVIVSDTLGQHLSGWIGIEVESEFGDEGEEIEVELERVLFQFNFFDDPYLNLRVGRFELGLPGVSSHRFLGPSPWMNSTPVGENGFTTGPVQNGFEFNGVLAGRLGYQAGIVEGRGNGFDEFKDVYGRVSYKLWGMRLDGVGGASSARPWRDDSVEVGVFGLDGRARIGADTATQLDRFRQLGGDVTARWWDLELKAAYAREDHDRPLLADPNQEADADHVFTQLDWVGFPWLIPSARYEYRRVADDHGESRIIPAIYALLRPNVRLHVLGVLATRDHEMDLDEISGGVSAAF